MARFTTKHGKARYSHWRLRRAFAVVVLLLAATLVVSTGAPAGSATEAASVAAPTPPGPPLPPVRKLCAIGANGCAQLIYNDPGPAWKGSVERVGDITSWPYEQWAGFTLYLDRGKIDNDFLAAYCPDVLQGIKRNAPPGQGWKWSWMGAGGVKDACVAELEKRFRLNALPVTLGSQDLAGKVRTKAVSGGLVNVTGEYGIACRNCAKDSQQLNLDLEVSRPGVRVAAKALSRSWSPGRATVSLEVTASPSAPVLMTNVLKVPSPQRFGLQVRQVSYNGRIALIVSSPALRHAGRGKEAITIVALRNRYTAARVVVTKPTSSVGLALAPACTSGSGPCARGPVTVEIWPDAAGRVEPGGGGIVAQRVVRLR